MSVQRRGGDPNAPVRQRDPPRSICLSIVDSRREVHTREWGRLPHLELGGHSSGERDGDAAVDVARAEPFAGAPASQRVDAVVQPLTPPVSTSFGPYDP